MSKTHNLIVIRVSIDEKSCLKRMDQGILLRVKFRERLEFIKFTNAELEFEKFLQKGFVINCNRSCKKQVIDIRLFVYPVFVHFGIKENVKFKIKIIDSIKTAIDQRYLKEVIEFFHSQENFFVEVVYEVDFNQEIKIVTPFVSLSCLLLYSQFLSIVIIILLCILFVFFGGLKIIREFLIKQNKDWILAEYSRTQNLSEYGRKQLVPELCAFMRTFFGGTIKKTDKILTIHAALNIFPNMRAQNGPEEVGTLLKLLKSYEIMLNRFL